VGVKLKRPGAPPAPATTPDDQAPDPELSVDDAADGVATTLDYNATYVSTPGAVGTGPVSAGVDAFAGRDPGVSAGDGSREISASLSTGGAYVEGTVAHDGGARTGGDVYIEPGWVSGGVDHSWASADGGARRAGASIAVFDGGLGAFGSGAISDAAGNTLKLSAGGWLDADRSILDLGETEGDGRRIELSRALGGSGIGSPGVLVDAIGIGGRFSVGKRRKIVYRTDVAHDDAKRLLTERGGVVGWARDTGRAMGLVDEPVVIPDLKKPETLGVGDELLTSTRGKMQAGLLVGGLPFRVGVQGTMSGEFEVGVKRLDEHRLALVVTPTKVSGVQARVGSPIALDADLSRSTARALRQAFVFDLREPDAKAAYLRALDGELPGGVASEAPPAPIGEDAADEVRRALVDEALPDGVERSYVEAVHLKRTQAGLGFAVGLWHRAGPFVGLGVQSIDNDETSARVTRDAAVTLSRRGVEQRRQLLISGEESRGIYATLRRTTRYAPDGTPARTFDGLQLSLRLSDSRVRGLELNDDAIDEINRTFGLELPHFSRDGRKKSREITVARTLTAADLERLATSDDDALTALRDALAGCDDAPGRAAVVQAHVARDGLSALGVISRALGGGRDAYDVATTSSAYEEPIDEARQLALRFDTPIDASTSKRELTRRFSDVGKALDDTREAIADARADPLLDDRASEKLVTALTAARARLQSLLAVDHLDSDAKDTLHDRLDRGWTTGLQKRVMRLLKPADG
jgi:hypothetical protein